MSGITDPYRFAYEHVGAGVTAKVMGGTGAVGDYLHRLICTVATSATSQVTIIDGSGTGVLTHIVLPNNSSVGVHNIEFNAASHDGAWAVTTGAGVQVLGVGIFSA